MKILWFTNTPSCYKRSKAGYNGGGWIESLERLVSVEQSVMLAVSFFHADDCFKVVQGNVVYYPIALSKSGIKKLKNNLFYSRRDKIEVDYYLSVIEDFKPDVIHVFGSEQSFGLISQYTTVPVVIHIQGILNPYLNAYFAPGNSKTDIILSNIFKPRKLFQKLREVALWSRHAKREAHILKKSNYFMGRTQWDKEVTLLYSPNAAYFYCSEVLRDDFYNAATWECKPNGKIIIMSTISKTSYKGFDLILKTAKILKQLTSIDFEWNVFGIIEYNEWEDRLKINSKEVNINLKGIVNSTSLVKNIQLADVFIHPSYIDNSPNSLCEAQIIGIPVISTNVGGISSLIENGNTGFLIPANDPYTLAKRILEIKENPEFARKIGYNARQLALKRHDRDIIKTDLLKIYNKLSDARNTR
ncbi:MAG TPA: glycosyltransferase [Phnomibacter sp.]|nr:glycosyltransferase [Phnomibacter sp.]